MKTKKTIINNTSAERWDKMMRYYKVFFSITFIVFGLVLLLDQVILLGILFITLGIQILPVKLITDIKLHIPHAIPGYLILLNIIAIFITFSRIVNT